MAADGAVHVLVVADNALLRDGLVSLLGQHEQIDVVGATGSCDDAVQRALVLRPSVVVMDSDVPGGGGVTVAGRLSTVCPEAVVCLLTDSDQEGDFFAAVHAGVRGYLLKDVQPKDLARAIITLAEGGVIVAPQLTRKLLRAFQQMQVAPAIPSIERLTPREREVLMLLGRGMSNRDIAKHLRVSVSTVKVHVRNILDKLRLRSRSQATVIAVRAGLAAPVRPHPDEFAQESPRWWTDGMVAARLPQHGLERAALRDGTQTTRNRARVRRQQSE